MILAGELYVKTTPHTNSSVLGNPTPFPPLPSSSSSHLSHHGLCIKPCVEMSHCMGNALISIFLSFFSDHSLLQDLTSLDGNPTGATGNILLSAGVRLLRVPKRLVHELSPKGQVTHFLQGHTPRQRCLTETEVQKHYLSAQTWIEYRKKVLDNVMDISRGRFIAHVSPTAKGSTGWSVWPGTKEQSQGFGI